MINTFVLLNNESMSCLKLQLICSTKKICMQNAYLIAFFIWWTLFVAFRLAVFLRCSRFSFSHFAEIFFPSIDLFTNQIIRFSGTDVSNVHFSNELLEMEGISQRQFINSPVSMTFQQSTLSTTDAFGSISSHSMLFLNIF